LQFSLTEEEYDEVSEAAARSGLARFCVRVIRRLEEAAEQLRRSVP